MKKSILSIIAFLLTAVGAKAQVVTVSDVEALPGETISFSLNLTGGQADTYTSLQFDIDLPTGITTTGFPTFSPSWPGATGPVGSTAAFASVEAMTGSDIENLVTISLKVDESVGVGTYDVTLSNIQFRYGTSGAHDDAANVTFKVYVVDRITLDENSTIAPMERTGVNVKVIRSLKKDSWNTICLPFNMKQTDVEEVFGNDVIIKEYKSYTADIDLNTLIASTLTLNFATYTMNALKPLKAGTPYLIKTSKDIESFDVDGVNIVSATSDVIGKETVYDLDGTFKGTLVKTKVPDKALFISNNKFHYSNGKTNIKAFRGWFELQAVLNEAIVVGSNVNLSFDDNATGINTVHSSEINAEGTYDLQGRKIENPKKGLYIMNGKKTVVK